MLTRFGERDGAEQTKPYNVKDDKVYGVEAAGHIMDADKREDVVSGQDDVDDLLSSLGF